MYETYQDHPKQAKGNIRVVLAVVFLACAIGAGIFLITRLASKPLSKEEARAQTGIVYDSSAVEGGWDNLSPEEIAEKLNEKVAEGMINISMNTAPYFEDGKAEGNVMIVNDARLGIVLGCSRLADHADGGENADCNCSRKADNGEDDEGPGLCVPFFKFVHSCFPF